jgi:hypothetical protein
MKGCSKEATRMENEQAKALYSSKISNNKLAQTKTFTKETGSTAKCKEKENTFFLQEPSTTASSLKTSVTGKASTYCKRCLKSSPNGKRYIGTWRSGKRNGTGKIEWPRGDVYIGYFVNGKRDGTGIFKSKDGVSYEGNWKNGKKHGEGKLTKKNGDVYFGKFKEDYIDGYGTMQYADGKLYEGEWKENKRFGEGVLTLKSGDRFLGTFIDEYLEGYGECYL